MNIFSINRYSFVKQLEMLVCYYNLIVCEFLLMKHPSD